MSNTGAVIKHDREQIRALYYNKTTRLGTAVLKNKNSFLSDVELMWFGSPNDTFPFILDEELNVCTRMPYQRVLDKFQSSVFPKPPADSGTCAVKVKNSRCGYVEIRGVNDSEYNVLKTAEYLLQRKWVGVVHTSEGAKLYLLPTCSLTHHLGMTSPDCVYPQMLHGLFVKKEKNAKQITRSASPSSASSSFVATPLPPQSSLAQSPVTDLLSDKAVLVPTTKSTPKKRKVVSFDLPSNSNIDDNKTAILSMSLVEQKAEAKLPVLSITPATIKTPLKKSVVAALREENTTSASETAKGDGGSQYLSPLREILSDEESVASSVSSLTSDTSSLLEGRPTRRKRGGRRRGGGRGNKALRQDQRTREEADLEGGESPKTTRRGGRGRRRGGRGSKSVPELSRELGVEVVVVKDSLKAEADKTLYELLKQDRVSITQVEPSEEEGAVHSELDTAAATSLPTSTPHTVPATVEKSPIREEEADTSTLPQRDMQQRVELSSSKQTDTQHSPVKRKKIEEDDQHYSAQPQVTAAISQDDQSITIAKTKMSLKSDESREESNDDATLSETVTAAPEVVNVAVEHIQQEKEGAAEIEQEIISQDGALGHVDEFIVMDGGGGHFVRPPKRVSLAEYKRRRVTSDDLLPRTDSTSSELSQPLRDREAVHTLVEASTQGGAEGGNRRMSPQTEAISEALKAEVAELKDELVSERQAKDSKSLEKDSVVKSKEPSSGGSVSKRLSPILPPQPLKKIASSTNDQSKSDTILTAQASKIPVPSSIILSRITPHQTYRFSSPISTPLPHHPTFPPILPTPSPAHPALPQPTGPSAAAAWGYSHLFYPQPGIGPGLTQPTPDHWPFGHQFYSPGAGSQSGSSLDFQSLRSLGFDDAAPPPPPASRSPDHLLLPQRRSISRSHSRSRSRSRTRSPSRSRSRSRTRSRSRSVTRSRSLSRSRSRSPLMQTRSRSSRSQSRSRNRSPRRNRGSSRMSRSRSPTTPDRLTNAMMQHLSEHLSAHILQTIHVREDKQKKELGVQASPSTSSLGAQVGSGFKLRSISSQTRRPARLSSRGIQCSSRTRGICIQTDTPNTHSTHSQTSIKKKSVHCQTAPMSMTGPSSNVFQALLQNKEQDFSEFTTVLENAKKNFAESIGLTLDDISDDDSFLDESVSLEEAGSVGALEEGHRDKEDENEEEGEGGDGDGNNTSQHMVPSPVISGASNISDGEWSDLEGSGSVSNSRKPSEPATPTGATAGTCDVSIPSQLQEVADALLSPTKPKGVATDKEELSAEPKCLRMDKDGEEPSAEPKSAIPPPAPTHPLTPTLLPATSSIDCDPSESPLLCSPISMVISPIADSDIDEILIEEQLRAEMRASKKLADKVEKLMAGESAKIDEEASTDKPPPTVVESNKPEHTRTHLEGAASSETTVDIISAEECMQQRSSTPVEAFGPSLPPDQPENTAYGPVLPPKISSEPVAMAAADTPTRTSPAYGPPLPPPKTSYDVPLPPTYGPALPPSVGVDSSLSKSSESAEEVQADDEPLSMSHGHGEMVKSKGVISDSQGVWHIRSVSLPPFKISGGSNTSSSNSNSGRSTPLISNKSTPLSSPGDDGSKSTEQIVTKQLKSASPQSQSTVLSSDSSEKLKYEQNTSVKPAPDRRRRQRSSGRESDDQMFKSPSERKRKRSRRHDSPEEKRSKGRESPEVKRSKKGNTSDDSSDSGSAAASQKKPKNRPDTLTTKKLQEPLESSSAKDDVPKAASSSPPSLNPRKFGSEPVLLPVKKKPVITAQELLEKVRAKKLKSPDESSKQFGREGHQGTCSSATTPDSPGSLIGYGGVLQSPFFIRETAGKLDSTINMAELMTKFRLHMAAKKKIQDSSWVHHLMPPLSPFFRPPPPPPPVPPPSVVLPPPPPPFGPPIDGVAPTSSTSSGDKATPPRATTEPLTSSAINASKMAAATEDDSEDDIDSQLEAILDSQTTGAKSKSYSLSESSLKSSSVATEGLVSVETLLSQPPKPPNIKQPASKEKDSSSPSLNSLLSSKQSVSRTLSEHFLVAELVQHTSGEESGTVGPAATSIAITDSHCPTGKYSGDREKVEVFSYEGEKCTVKSQHCHDTSAASEQLNEQPSLPSVQQHAQADAVLKLKSVQTMTQSVSNIPAMSTPDHPINIMYQSSVLDPVSPTGLSDGSPMELSVEQAFLNEEKQRDSSPKHTTSEHISESVTESSMGDLCSHQSEGSENAKEEQVRPTGQRSLPHQTLQAEYLSRDSVTLRDTASAAERANAVQQVESDVMHEDVPFSLDKKDRNHKQYQEVIDISLESQAPKKLPTQQYSGLPSESGSNQSLGDGALNQQGDSPEQVDHDNIALATTWVNSILSILSKSSQEEMKTTTDTKTAPGTESDKQQEREQAPLCQETTQEIDSGHQTPKEESPVMEQEKQELKQEVISQLESPGINRKQEKDLPEVEPQLGYEKDMEVSKDNQLKSTDSPLVSDEHEKSEDGDLEPAPEKGLEGQESRDPSPEIFRGKISEETPDLTDVSREEFVVSRSPSFSPSKLTTISSSTHRQITTSIDGIVSTVLTEDGDMHTPPLVHRSSELCDVQAGDMDMDVFLKESSIEEQSFDVASRSCASLSATSDPFADTVDCNSPLWSPSKSSEVQLPPSVKDMMESSVSLESVFGDSANSSSPLQSQGSSSERQLQSSNELTTQAVDCNISVKSVFGDSTDSSSPLQSVGSFSESVEKQQSLSGEVEQEIVECSIVFESVFVDLADNSPQQSPDKSCKTQVHVPPPVELTVECGNSADISSPLGSPSIEISQVEAVECGVGVESLSTTNNALSSVIDGTVRQVKQISVPSGLDTESVSKNLDCIEERSAAEVQSKGGDGDNYADLVDNSLTNYTSLAANGGLAIASKDSDSVEGTSVLEGRSKAETEDKDDVEFLTCSSSPCISLSKSKSNDVLVATQRQSLPSNTESGQMVSVPALEPEEKSTETAIQERDHKQGDINESQEVSITVVASTQPTTSDEKCTPPSSAAAETTPTEKSSVMETTHTEATTIREGLSCETTPTVTTPTCAEQGDTDVPLSLLPSVAKPEPPNFGTLQATPNTSSPMTFSVMSEFSDPPTQQSTPISCTVSTVPSTPQATPTAISLDPPTTPHSVVLEAPPKATPMPSATGSSSSVMFSSPTCVPNTPANSTVTSSAKSVTSLLPATQTTPTVSTTVSPSPLLSKAQHKRRKPKTRIVPPRSCNTSKSGPDISSPAASTSSAPPAASTSSAPPATFTSSASVAASTSSTGGPSSTSDSLPALSSLLKLLPSQPNSPAPTITAESLIKLLHMLCKSTPDQQLYLTVPSMTTASKSTGVSSASAKVSKVSTPSTKVNVMSSIPRSSRSTKSASTAPSTRRAKSQQLIGIGAKTSAQPLLDSQKAAESPEPPPVNVEESVAITQPLLGDQKMAAVIEEESSDVTGMDEVLSDLTENPRQDLSQPGLSCIEEGTTTISTTDQSLPCGVESNEKVIVDDHPCGQRFKQDASLTEVEAKPDEEMNFDEDITSTDMTGGSVPSSGPEEKSDTVHTSMYTGTHLERSEVPDKIEGRSIGMMGIESPTSETVQAGEDSSVVSPQGGLIAASSASDREVADERKANNQPSLTQSSSTLATDTEKGGEKETDIRKFDKKQSMPAESCLPLATEVEKGGERDSERETLEVLQIPVSLAEKENGPVNSNNGENAPSTPETSYELLPNVNCRSNSETASPTLEGVSREQLDEADSLCASASSDVHELVTQEQGTCTYSSLTSVMNVPASREGNFLPTHTDDGSKAGDVCSATTVSSQTDGEGAARLVILEGQPLETAKPASSSFEQKECSRRGSRSPLFISLPAQYSSQQKRTIKGPSERYRTPSKGKGKPLIVSLPLTLYWRRCQELNSQRLLRSMETSPFLHSPITPIMYKKCLKKDVCSSLEVPGLVGVSFDDINKAQEIERSSSPSSLVVSYQLSSLVLPSTTQATEISKTEKTHCLADPKKMFAVVEISSEEISSQTLPHNDPSENEVDTPPASCSCLALPGSPVKTSYHFLSTPPWLSKRRMHIAGNPLCRERKLKTKRNLDSIVNKLSRGTKTPGVAEGSDYSQTVAMCVDFLSPEDYTCESEGSTSPHVVVIDSSQNSEEKGLSTGEDRQDVVVPEKSAEPLERHTRKSSRQLRGSKATPGGREESRTLSHEGPPGRKRRRRRSERVHHSVKNTELEAGSTSSCGGDQEKVIKTSPNETKPSTEDHTSTSALGNSLKDLLQMTLTPDTTAANDCPSSHDHSDIEAEGSSGVVSESPDESISPPVRPRAGLPALKMYLRRSEHDGVPYRVNESPPPPEGETFENSSSSSSGRLTRLGLLLDPKFRNQNRKSTRKSRLSKRRVQLESSAATTCASIISPEVPECSTMKKSMKVIETEDKTKTSGPSNSSSPLISPLFEENAPLISSIFEKVSKSLSTSSTSSCRTMKRARSYDTTQSEHSGYAQDSSPIKSASVESPSVSAEFESVASGGEKLSKCGPLHPLTSLSSSFEEVEASTSVTATTAALKWRKSDESAPVSNCERSTVCNSAKATACIVSTKVSSSSEQSMILKKSRSASPVCVRIAPPTKKQRLSSPKPLKHEATSESSEISGRIRKCRSTSPIRSPRRERKAISLNRSADKVFSWNRIESRNSDTMASKRSSHADKKSEDLHVCESSSDNNAMTSKKMKPDDSKPSDRDKRSPPSDLLLRRNDPKSAIKHTDQKSPTKSSGSTAGDCRAGDCRSGHSSHSSVGRSRASSAPSCTPERERERASYHSDRERERLRHPYSGRSTDSREASPTRFQTSSPPLPFSRYHEPDQGCNSPQYVPPPDVWYRHSSLLGDSPFPPPNRPPHAYGPPCYSSFSAPHYYPPLLPLPPPHMHWSHNTSPYGPPPRLPLDRNPYNQRNYHSANQRYGRYTFPAREWYRDTI